MNKAPIRWNTTETDAHGHHSNAFLGTLRVARIKPTSRGQYRVSILLPIQYDSLKAFDTAGDAINYVNEQIYSFLRQTNLTHATMPLLAEHEVKALLDDPRSLEVLMDYHDQQETLADAADYVESAKLHATRRKDLAERHSEILKEQA